MATIRPGDGARNEKVVENLGLVVTIARGFVGKGLPLPDLVQAGCLGMIEAVERYDPAKGVRFSTYARSWVRMTIIEELRWTARTVRVPKYAWKACHETGHAVPLAGHDRDRDDRAPSPLDWMIAREEPAAGGEGVAR